MLANGIEASDIDPAQAAHHLILNAKMIVRGKDRACGVLEPVHLAANKIGCNEVEVGFGNGGRAPSLPDALNAVIRR